MKTNIKERKQRISVKKNALNKNVKIYHKACIDVNEIQF